MHSFADLIDSFGGAAKMAPEINQVPNTIRQWSARGSIPARYWRAIIEAAERLDIKNVNAGTLAELASASISTARCRRPADGSSDDSDAPTPSAADSESTVTS